MAGGKLVGHEEAILALAKRGLGVVKIIHDLDLKCSDTLVSLFLKRERASDPEVPLLRNGPSQTMRVPCRLVDALEPYARRRGTQPTRLAAKLLAILVDERLVSSILDDGVSDNGS